LVAGQTYTFVRVGVGVFQVEISDPLLRLPDSSGNQLIDDDDGRMGKNSSITSDADSIGTFYITPQSHNNHRSQNYDVSIRADDGANSISWRLSIGQFSLINRLGRVTADFVATIGRLLKLVILG
jgi:hypothetical protein